MTPYAGIPMKRIYRYANESHRAECAQTSKIELIATHRTAMCIIVTMDYTSRWLLWLLLPHHSRLHNEGFPLCLSELVTITIAAAATTYNIYHRRTHHTDHTHFTSFFFARALPVPLQIHPYNICTWSNHLIFFFITLKQTDYWPGHPASQT